ncbi:MULTISPECIES: HAD family hydrolase [Lactococcus]|uniref:HAD family hydrolase n=1 Tax=Lactococcus TaxID=1357 RepID=UPI000EE86247|nr:MULTISPECIES: HAD-IIIA family hydrolase [Lactococcus]HAP15925.1 haloacid dehalogenase [Lactococcus sp.]
MEAYIFDFDGTLANSGKTGILATQSAFQEFNLKVPSEKMINYYTGIPIEKSFKKMLPDYAFRETEFQALLSAFRQYYKEYEQENLTLFPHIKEVLQKLKSLGKRLYVVSSKHSVALKRNLEYLDIAVYFEGVVGSDQVEHYKPAPDGVLYILKTYRIDPEDSIMIGDASFDIQMGKAAGIKTCAVSWGAHSFEDLDNEAPNFLINHVEDLLKL